MSNVINALPVKSVISALPVKSVISASNVAAIISAKPISSIVFDGSYIPDFNSNAEAIAGGLSASELYRTPDQKINVVVIVIGEINITTDLRSRFSQLWRAFW
jgi:hypothetical protein